MDQVADPAVLNAHRPQRFVTDQDVVHDGARAGRWIRAKFNME
jgi:hypothetical protein